MTTTTQSIRIQHETYGVILKEDFVDPTQFKLFLKMVNGCFATQSDLTFFNGQDFFINVPFKTLKNSIITTQVEPYTLANHIVNKSKIEQPL
jgi:hypothetical protein